MGLIDAIELKAAISVSAMLEDGKHIFDIIDEQPTIEQPHWTPCSERLPAEGNNVLLSDDLNVTIGRLIHYTDIGYKWEIDHWDYDLEDWQAWMQLPEPYKEGEEC